MKARVGLRTSVLLLALGLMGLQSASASTTRELNENSGGKIYAVSVGSHLTLTLHSMYWSLTPFAKNSGLAQVGEVVSKPILPGPTAPKGCGIPGMGCGTQTWTFIAKKAGTYSISAARTSCGEALQCTGKQGSYSVTIRVKK